MTREEIERLWKDKQYWVEPGFYSCPKDPRIVVPKPIKWMGWTLNFAHKEAIFYLIFFCCVAAGPLAIIVLLGVRDLQVVYYTVAGSILTIIGWAWYLSNQTE